MQNLSTIGNGWIILVDALAVFLLLEPYQRYRRFL